MTELDDLEIDPAGREGDGSMFVPPRRRVPVGAVLSTIVILLAAGLLGYWAYRSYRPRPTPPPPTPQPTLAPTPTPVPSPEAAGLPSLDASDGLVRELAQALSSHPLFGAWLGQQDLVRLVVVVVDNIAGGESPRPHLGFAAPKGSFAVVQRSGRVFIDPASYGRYDFFAAGVASLDAPACAELHRKLLPLTEAAYRELGHPQGGFSAGLGRAIAQLLAVPVLEGSVEVQAARRGNRIVHVYADAKLEALTPAQKHLLRMGPANVKRVQAKLRELAAALGTAPGP
jgi:hypothetical protein